VITVTTLLDRERDATDGPPLDDACAKEPEAVHRWITIAMRPRKCLAGEKLYWQPISGAPVSAQEARSLADAGTLLIASRYLPDRVELVVRPRTAREPSTNRARS
jgi:hypothetical protein